MAESALLSRPPAIYHSLTACQLSRFSRSTCALPPRSFPSRIPATASAASRRSAVSHDASPSLPFPTVSRFATARLSPTSPSLAERRRSIATSEESFSVLGRGKRLEAVVSRAFLLPVDPWSPNIDSQSIASSLFAVSLFPYLGFLYYLTRSKTAPPITLFGFYFLLAFVGATIPAGIYAKVHYGTSLSNVDYLHGSAESLLTVTNLFIVFGLRKALRDEAEEEAKASDSLEIDSSKPVVVGHKGGERADKVE